MNLERLKKIGVSKNIIEKIPKGIKIKKFCIAYFTLEQREDLQVCCGEDISAIFLDILRKELN